MPEILTAWATLAISTRDAERDVRRAFDRIDTSSAGRRAGQQFGRSAGQGADFTQLERKAEESGKRSASKWGTAFKTFAGGLTAALGAGGVAGVFTVLDRGFDRLKTIDSARFKLQALGNDAGTVKTIMDSALKSVQGTAFSMGDAASAAAAAVAAGVKPGEELTKYLTSVGDSAAVAGTSFSDMASIFNKVRANGVAYTDDLQQLQDRGLPVMQLLRESYGVTADEFRKMVEDGKVSSADFEKVLTQKIGGAAQKMGQSFEGSMQNLTAATARVGANFLTAIFGGTTGDELAGPTAAVQALTDKFDQVNQWIVANGPQIRAFFTTMAEDVKVVAGQLGNVLGFLAEHPHAITVAVAAFAAFKTIEGVTSAVTAIKAIGTALDLLPGKATKSAGGISAALAGITAPAWLTALLGGAAVATVGDGVRRAREQGANPASAGRFPEVDRNQRRGDEPRLGGGGGHFASGGAVIGAGGPTSDIIPMWASNGEHVLTAGDVAAMGGQAKVYAFRNALHRAEGGAVGDEALLANVPAGRYTQTQGADLTQGLADCSSAIEDLVNLLDGNSTAGRSMSTANEAEWLTAHGFLPGKGGPGDFRVGFNSHHTQATLPGGTPFNWGSDAAAARRGIGGTGADDPSFTSHFYRPQQTGADITQAYADSLAEGGQEAVDQIKDQGSTRQGPDGASFGQSLISGLLQGVGLDGSVFSNPLEWPNVKSAMALVNWGGGLLKSAAGGQDTALTGGGGGLPGLNMPHIADFIKPMGAGPTAPIGTPASGVGLGPAPGPAIVNNGVIGMDPRALTQRADAHQNQAWRKNMSAVRPAG